MITFILWCILFCFCWPLALARARGLSHRVAHTFAVSHCGNSSAWRFGVFARAFFLPARLLRGPRAI